jgi:hypothetical protein
MEKMKIVSWYDPAWKATRQSSHPTLIDDNNEVLGIRNEVLLNDLRSIDNIE